MMRTTALVWSGVLSALAILAAPPRVPASGGPCTFNSGPDVIVGALPATQKWGTVGGITAYSFATTSCNIGDEILPWFDDNNQHPVIAQNLYRVKDGRIDQLGMSWVKHGFGALAQNLCCTCQNPGTFDFLGVGCSDPYTTGLNSVPDLQGSSGDPANPP